MAVHSFVGKLHSQEYFPKFIQYAYGFQCVLYQPRVFQGIIVGKYALMEHCVVVKHVGFFFLQQHASFRVALSSCTIDPFGECAGVFADGNDAVYLFVFG